MSIESDIKQHALDEYPNECVGYVSGGVYHRLSNISPKPYKRYKLSVQDKLMLFRLGDKLTALVHSHPCMDNKPSEKDSEAQRACAFPFWIVGTNGRETTDINEVE